MLDESPTWLLSHGRFDDAVKIVKRMLKMNKMDHINVEDLKDTKSEEEEEVKTKWRDVIMARTLLLNTVLFCFGWYVESLLNTGSAVVSFLQNTSSLHSS